MTAPTNACPPHPPLVAMVHYHLRRGGVTRVIQNAVTALAGHACRVVVVSGEPPSEGVHFDCPVVVVDGLGYHESGPRLSLDTLLDRIQKAIRRVCNQEPDIWHIHNHSLGKNATWTQAVHWLSARGIPLLLQIHDFAEDGRPQNYHYLRKAWADMPGVAEGLEPLLYPQSTATHYATLNQRDQAMLLHAGMPDSRVHHLPNAAWIESSDATASAEQNRHAAPPLILYPTRAIRRKNIGEFLLLSLMDSQNRRYGITLAPESPGERPAYERWRRVASELSLPVEFELGLTQPFAELMQSATALATTSIAEGFGLAFLEPWLNDRPVAGRNLPEITIEFEESGISLHNLYTELSLPAAWIDSQAFRQRFESSFRQSRQAYGQEVAAADIEQAWQEVAQDDRIEFGHLDEVAQEEVLRHLHASPESRVDISPQDWLDDLAPVGTIADHRRQIEERYGLDQYGRRLRSLYKTIMTSSKEKAAPSLQPGSVLDQFLSPHHFRMLRT